MTQTQHQWVHFLSIQPGFENPSKNTLKALYRGLGNNTGNMLFTNALRRQIRFKKATFGYDIPGGINAESPDLVVIPAANWLNPGVNLGNLAVKIEAFDGPCLLAGLGAQAPLNSEYPPIPSGTIRFLKAVSERTKLIGLRGDYSAKALEFYGFSNHVVTGCPSLYWHCSPQFPSVAYKNNYQLENTIIQSKRHTILPNATYLSEPDRTLRELMLYAFKNNCHQVFQSEFEEMFIALGRENNAKIMEEITPKLEEFYQHPLDNRMREYFKNRTKVFFNIEQWIDFTKEKDLTCGARLHGCVMSMISGVPAILLHHDSRTKEAAEFAGIPTHHVTEFFNAGGANALAERTDFSLFQTRYEKNYPVFKQFMEHNNIANNLS